MERRPRYTPGIRIVRRIGNDPYAHADPSWQLTLSAARGSYAVRIGSLDDLMERDKQREADGFPRKIRIGRLVKPGRGGQHKVVVVPTTVEEKLLHDNKFADRPEGSGGAGGSGEGEEGEIIGEQPVRPEAGEDDGSGPGQGEGGPHELESNAYDLGRILTEQFQLPNLEDKGKRRSLTRYVFDFTDRHRGAGQLLDKKATLRQIVETNIALGNVKGDEAVDPAGLMIAPRDKVYRVLAKERDFESQAVVFFLRDYSGSMSGRPTEQVVSQHVLIYSWILYQYAGQIDPRFILHDTDAREVDDFYTYYNSRVAGGTKVASAFQLVNEIVARENLAQDNNIYVFHGTDGDDWDTDGKECLPAIETMLGYAARVGVTVVASEHGAADSTAVVRYLTDSGLLAEQRRRLRLDVMPEAADEQRLIDGIRELISA